MQAAAGTDPNLRAGPGGPLPEMWGFLTVVKTVATTIGRQEAHIGQRGGDLGENPHITPSNDGLERGKRLYHQVNENTLLTMSDSPFRRVWMPRWHATNELEQAVSSDIDGPRKS